MLQNVGSVRSVGFEAAGDVKLGGGLSLFASYSYTDAKYRNDVFNVSGVLLAAIKDKTVVDTPKHMIRGELEGALAAADADFAPYIDYPTGAPLNQWAELNKSRRWRSLWLWRDGVAQRLMKTNTRLPRDKAEWLAGRWASPDAAGQWKIRGHAGHKVTSAHLYRLDEMLEVYKRITAPLLSVQADSDSLAQWWKGSYTLDEYHERLKNVPDARSAVIANAGHMLHHDQPEQLARLIEDFRA